MTFNPNEHLMQFERKSKKNGAWVTTTTDYLPVQWRLVWFREACPQGTIHTEEIVVDMDKEVEEEASVYNQATQKSEKVTKRGRGYARFKATVTDGMGGSATGTKSETIIGFPDYIEKAETGAIGRALAGLGYGTQFTGDEFDERSRLADAPVSRGDEQAVSEQAAPRVPAPDNRITPSQMHSIKNLCKLLQREVAPNIEALSQQSAKESIAELSKQWRAVQFKQSQQQSA